MSQKQPIPAEIYGLYCPTTGALRYIGKAANSQKRLKSHLRDAKRRNTPVCKWIVSLLVNGQVPRMEVLVVSGDWVADERAEISKARANGADLLNLAPGGNQPFCPPDARARIGRENARAIHGNPSRRKIWYLKMQLGILLRQGHVREETKAKMRLAAAKRPNLFGCWAGI